MKWGFLSNRFSIASPLQAFLFAVLILSGLSHALADNTTNSPTDVLWNQAQAAIERDNYSNARNLLEDFIKRNMNDPRVPQAKVYLGICDYNQRKVPKALQAWNQTVNMEIMQKKSSPGLLLALEQLAIHHRTDQNMSELNKILDHLLKSFPEAPLTVRECTVAARSRLETGDYADAAELYGKVSGALKGTDIDDYQLAKALSDPGGSIDAILISANDHLTRDSAPVATGLFREALNRNPSGNQRLEAMTLLGWCLLLQGKDKEAEKLWTQVVAAGEKGNEWRGKSRWHLVALNAGPLHDRDEAISLCEEQAQEFSGGFLGQQAVFTRAWLLKYQGKWKEAKAGFEKLLADYPATADCPPVHQYIRECEDGMSARK